MTTTDLSVGGHLTRLKWHRARRTLSDTPFTLGRIIEGLWTGASVEIDVRVDRNGVPLIGHDVPRAWRPGGTRLPLETLNEALGDAVAQTPLPPTALLQLDIKDAAGQVAAAAVDRIAAAVAPFSGSVIVSGSDPVAVSRIAAADPKLRLGHDPCTRRAVRQLGRSGDITGFVRTALAAQPAARTIYLDRRVILGLADAVHGPGHDIVADFHAVGLTVDAYTLTGPDPVLLQQARALVRLRVDQITTDDAEGFAAALGSAAVPG